MTRTASRDSAEGIWIVASGEFGEAFPSMDGQPVSRANPGSAVSLLVVQSVDGWFATLGDAALYASDLAKRPITMPDLCCLHARTVRIREGGTEEDLQSHGDCTYLGVVVEDTWGRPMIYQFHHLGRLRPVGDDAQVAATSMNGAA